MIERWTIAGLMLVHRGPALNQQWFNVSCLLGYWVLYGLFQVAHQEEPLKLTQAETKLKNSEKEATIKINKARSDAKIAIAR